MTFWTDADSADTDQFVLNVSASALRPLQSDSQSLQLLLQPPVLVLLQTSDHLGLQLGFQLGYLVLILGHLGFQLGYVVLILG